MCLSVAYKEICGKREKLLEYVSSVAVSGNDVILKTILGEQQVVPGWLRLVDLNDNIIVIEGKEAQ